MMYRRYITMGWHRPIRLAPLYVYVRQYGKRERGGGKRETHKLVCSCVKEAVEDRQGDS